MDNRRKTKKELVKELQDLQKENIALNALLNKKFTVQKQSENEITNANNGLTFQDDVKEKLSILNIDEKHRALFENTQDIFVQIDLAGIILNISSSIKYHPEFDINELIGTSVSNLYYDLEVREIILKELMKNGEIRDYEFRIKTKTGNIKFVSSNACLIANDDGTLSHIAIVIRDITERKLAEEILRENEIKYRALVENSPDTIIIYVEGKIVFANKESLHLMAIESTENLIGETGLQFIHPDFQKKVIERIHEVTTKGVVLPFTEEKFIRSDGSQVDVEVKAVPIMLEMKPAVQLIIRDITLRKQSEEAIRIIENKYQTLFENLKDVFYRTDLEGTILEVSPSIKYFSELNRDEIIGSTFDNFYANPVDKLYLLNELTINGEITDYELNFKIKTDVIKYVSINARLINDQNNKPKYIDGSIRDITERKLVEKTLRKSEEKYRYMFANNPQPMWIYEEGTLAFLEVNEAAIDHYGYSKQEFLSMTIKDIRPAEDIPSLLVDVKSTRTPYNKAGEWRHIKKNGEFIFVEIISHSVIFNDRAARHVLVHDFTHRKNAENALNNSQEELRKFAAHLQNVREEEKIGIAREIHDDLGQFLAALKIDLGLFKKKISKEIRFLQPEEVLFKFDELLGLVDKTIKTTRRIMNGLRPQIIDSLGFVEAGKSYLSEFEERSHINCQFESSILELNINPQQSVALFRILQEALTNINKHARASGVKVQLNYEDDKLIMEVIDNGIGFDTDYKGRKDSYGLIGMKERVILLEGILDITSKLGRGTNVRVEIPYMG